MFKDNFSSVVDFSCSGLSSAGNATLYLHADLRVSGTLEVCF